MRIACWMPKATHTHTHTHTRNTAVPLTTMVTRTHLNITLYVHFPSGYRNRRGLDSGGITVFCDVTLRRRVCTDVSKVPLAFVFMGAGFTYPGPQCHSPCAWYPPLYRCDTVNIGLDLSCSRYGAVTVCCEHGFEPTVLHKNWRIPWVAGSLCGLSRRVLLLS